jgi:hypothetical protein
LLGVFLLLMVIGILLDNRLSTEELKLVASGLSLLLLAFKEVRNPASQFLSGVLRYVEGVTTSPGTIGTFWRNHRDLKLSDGIAAAALNGVGVNF